MNPLVSLLFVLLVVVQLSPISSYPADDHHDSSSSYTGADQHQYDNDKDESPEHWKGAIPLSIPTISENLPFGDFLSFSQYHKSCPNLEGIINRKLNEWLKKDKSLAASIMRLHFHDCAIRGCDASILLNHEGSERTASVSKTLRGFEVIDDIKAEVEKECPKTVSCADILTAATRDATVMVGGPYWMVPYGRKDGRVSIAKEAEGVPMGYENITALVEFFQSLDLNVVDLVVLSGAHTIGRASCASIQSRLFNFAGYGTSDTSIDEKYLNFLKRKCRWGSDYVDLDATTPKKFDTAYYSNLQRKMGLLKTDQLLYSETSTSPLVTALARQPAVFYHQFGVSMTKLGNVQVRTGQDEGEIRTNCNFVNSY